MFKVFRSTSPLRGNRPVGALKVEPKPNLPNVTLRFASAIHKALASSQSHTNSFSATIIFVRL